eukprot:TRINITY_DN14352_c0_g2_i1.p1 TRINITY_DN14352_c0_g2~~TRINITY_DN14352_c0_g2_i1.p1  ORF type:complete len:360 (-),score=34.04 TRINITY_DN14352_c0_g2_i1:11-1090(-)
MPGSVPAMPGLARAVGSCAAMLAVSIFVAGEDVLDAVIFARGATQMHRRIVRQATRKRRTGVIGPSFRDGVMAPTADASVDATGSVERAEVIMLGQSESSDAATVAAATASRSKHDAFEVTRFADMAAGTVDGTLLPSRSHAVNGTWLNLKGKTSFQSSTANGAASWRAVDGSAKNKWIHGSCMTTKADSPSFWQVDLTKNFSITHISVLRELRTSQTINSLSVAVDGRKCIDSASFPSGVFEKELKCDAVGQSVRLSKQGTLVVCEVKLRVKTWRQISETRICEGYFALGRAHKQIKSNFHMNGCSLESCQDVCQRETACRSIDWFTDTCICQLYSEPCPADKTTRGHNGGSSYELES